MKFVEGMQERLETLRAQLAKCVTTIKLEFLEQELGTVKRSLREVEA